MVGQLTLIPTPIDEESKLSIEAFALLSHHSSMNLRSNSLFVIEDLKPGRKRWLSFGLTRDIVNDFVLLNEHNFKAITLELIDQLKKGKNVFLMSDGGLPAFCDPGQALVYQCHRNKIKVTSTPFCNSVSLALALSGLSHQQFMFYGFMPMEKSERQERILSMLKSKTTSIVMDTPYRLERLLNEILELDKYQEKELFLALDLNKPTEELWLLKSDALVKAISSYKREFILIFEGK